MLYKGCKLWRQTSGVGSISWLVPARPRARDYVWTYAKIIAESELLQPALNEIHKFCFQHWSRSRGTCGSSSGAPANMATYRTQNVADSKISDDVFISHVLRFFDDFPVIVLSVCNRQLFLENVLISGIERGVFISTIKKFLELRF